MQKFILGLVLCGFAAITVGCGADAPKPADKKVEAAKPAEKPKS
jgi:hypothetical protein